MTQFLRGYVLIHLLLFSVVFAAICSAQCRDGNPNHGGYQFMSEAFPQLENLTNDTGTGRAPSRGGQNFTHCCLLAVNYSLSLNDSGYVTKHEEHDFIRSSIQELFNASVVGQFPCGAVWNSAFPRGAPVVEVPDYWLESNCPGWQLSDSRKGDESEWLLPFTGFLLPAIVFVLTIPRRRKLKISNKLFALPMKDWQSWVAAPFAMAIAGAIATFDTIIWLSICFAFAGPMLISGIYEAFLDSQILAFLKSSIENKDLTLDMRARLLFVILIGNMDFDPKRIDSDYDLDLFESKPAVDDSHEKWPDHTIGDPNKLNRSSPWTHMENLIYPLRSFRDQDTGTPRQWPMHNVNCATTCNRFECHEEPLPRNDKKIGKMKTRVCHFT